MSMPSKLKEAFEVLDKYEYQNKTTKNWHSLISGGYYEIEIIRLKKERPLTVEEAEKLEQIYVPYVHISLSKGVIPEYFDISNNIEIFAKSDLAYRTPRGAIAHAQMWLDMEVEK